jgi:hypothetical protein
MVGEVVVIITLVESDALVEKIALGNSSQKETAMDDKGARAGGGVLMPKVAPTLKLANYPTLKTCTKWLGELAGGRTWVEEMKAMEEDNELNPTAH